MYDIEALEHQWKRYHRKRLLRRALLGLGVVVLITAPILYVTLIPPMPKEEKSANPHKNRGGKSNERIAENNRTGPIPPQTLRKEEPLKPESPSISAQKSKKPKMLITLSDPGSGKAEGKETAAEKKIRMEMTDVKNTQVVKEIEARFPATRDYDDAMYLAKYYYGKKKYKKAEYWATQANSIDSAREESWIIFGKAKAKQGHRIDALRVLQAYYDRSGSMRVKELIYRIRKGKTY